jgi:hemerythrin-like domain-containing protein
MIDPFQTAPGFDDPIGVLRACHRRMERQLATLDRLCKHVAVNHADADARTAAAAIMRYFDTAAVNHHADEEQTLLPRLRSARPDLSDFCKEIEREHAELGERWRRLRPRLAAIAVGRSGYLPLREVDAFRAGYSTHIGKEEERLFDAAQSALDAAILAEIGEEMAARRNL